MGLFKTKEEKLKILEDKLIHLNDKFGDTFNHYHMVNKEVFILKGFKIKNGELFYVFLDKDTPKGYTNSYPINHLYDRFGIDFRKTYYNWIEFKDNLEKLNLKVLYI